MSPSEDFFLHKSEDATVSTYEDKQGFYIFDFCDNFDFFRINPDGREPKNALNLSQRIFNLKVEIVYSLQSLEHQTNEMHKAYYEKTRSQLIEMVKKLNRNLVNVRYQLKYVDKYSREDYWQYLSILDVKEIKNQVTNLIDPNGDEESSKIFDLWMFNIELAEIAGDKDYSKAVQKVTTICRALLDKLTIPQVNAKKDVLETACKTEFWEGIDIDKLEMLRNEVRDLIKFLDREVRGIIETNFSDEVIDKKPDSIPTMQFKNYKERVIDYLSEHSDIPAIAKIRNIEQLNETDIIDLEDILWNQLGSRSDYENISNGKSVGVFVRSIVGLSRERVNEILSDYLREYSFNTRQEEFLNEIVNFVLENGDIRPDDLYESEPFKHQEYTDIFDGKTDPIYNFIGLLHGSVSASVGA